MLKLIRIRELIEAFPEFAEHEAEFEKMPTCVFYFMYCGPEILKSKDVPLIHRLTGCMGAIDQGIDVDPEHVKMHLQLLVNSKDYLRDQVLHIEELHLFQRTLLHAKNMLDKKDTELGNKIARRLAVDFLGEDFVKEMEKKKIMRISAKNGKSYWLGINGKIRAFRTRRRQEICTHVGDIEVPWDKVVIHAALLKTDKRFCNMVERAREA